MELLLKNPDLPDRAGKARLEFSKTDGPGRKDDVITLPLRSQAQFFKLKSGEQFLYAVVDRNELYFGGTDEEPFLVRLNSFPLGAFRTGGEKAFFETLVPDAIRYFQRVLGTGYKRQGDIFAVSAPISWNGLRAIRALQLGCSVHEVEPERMDFNVFETRHRFSGIAINVQHQVGSLQFTLFVEGRIKAPDHEDLSLKEPHFLAQTAHLFNSKQAD